MIHIFFIFLSFSLSIYCLWIKDFVFSLLFGVFVILFSWRSYVTLTNTEKKIQKVDISSLMAIGFSDREKKVIVNVVGVLIVLFVVGFFVITRLNNKGSIAPAGSLQDPPVTTSTEDKIALYERRLSDDPNDMDSVFKLATAYVAIGQHEKAITLFEDTKGRRKDDIPVYHRLADLYYELGEKEKALAVLDETLRVAPENAAVYGKYGSMLYTMNMFEEAVEKLRKAVELDTQYGEAYYFLALSLRQTDSTFDNFDEVIRTCIAKARKQTPWYEKCLELN